MILRKRRVIESRNRRLRVRPAELNFSHIHGEVRIYHEVGVILKQAGAYKKLQSAVDRVIGNKGGDQ